MTRFIRKIVFFSFCAIFSQYLYSQSNVSIDDLKLRLGYSKYPGPEFTVGGIYKSYNNYRLDANHRLLGPIGIGGHLGYSKTITTVDDPDNHFDEVGTLFIGGNVDLHIIPIFTKTSDFPIDFYLLGRYGGYYLPSADLSYPSRGLYREIKHGFGLDILVFKGFGIYGEYSFDKLKIFDGIYRFGISLKT